MKSEDGEEGLSEGRGHGIGRGSGQLGIDFPSNL